MSYLHVHNIVIIYRGGTEWKRIHSAGNKQILPQRVAKFVTPLSEIADDLIEQLGKSRDEDGNISDMREFVVKWSFQGTCSSHSLYLSPLLLLFSYPLSSTLFLHYRYGLLCVWRKS